jgi:PAS domain-containing protein
MEKLTNNRNDPLRQALEHTRIGLAVIDLDDRAAHCHLDGTYVEVNEVYGRMLGRTPEDLYRLTVLDVTSPECKEQTGRQPRCECLRGFSMRESRARSPGVAKRDGVGMQVRAEQGGSHEKDISCAGRATVHE